MPPVITEPVLARRTPTTSRASVDLPDPLSPAITTTSADRTMSDTESSAGLAAPG